MLAGEYFRSKLFLVMEPGLRAEFIRKGNQAFNEGDYGRARELFTKAAYKDGLIRLGDYYMYEKRLPLLAYGYYKRAGANAKIEDLHRRMVLALGAWLGRDKIREESLKSLGIGGTPANNAEPDDDGMIPIQVSPVLREAALKILEHR